MDPLLVQILSRIDLYPNCPALANYQVTVRDSERWVTLSGDPSRIPPNAASTRQRTSPQSQRADVDRLHSVYWGEAPWFSNHRIWLGYIPDTAYHYEQSKATLTDWTCVDYVTTKEHLDAEYRDRVDQDLCSVVLSDFEAAKVILDELQVHLKPDGPDLPANVPLLARTLDTRRGEQESLIAVLECREALIEWLRAISYGLHYVSDREKDQIVAAHGQRLRAWHVLEGRKLGVLLDLAGRPDNDIPLLAFLRDRVPVHYPVDDKFLPDRQLRERLAINYVLRPDNVEVALRHAVLHTTRTLYEQGDLASIDDVPSDYPREPTDEEWNEILHPSSSSRSSPTPSFEEYAIIDEILKIQRDPGAAMRPFQFSTSVPILTRQIYWSDVVVNNAYLLIETLEEAKARSYAEDSRFTEAADVLSELVQRGIAFRLAYQRDYIGRRLSRIMLPPREPIPPKPRGLLRNSPDVSVSWARYRARVHDLLLQPNAVSFIMAGGLLWRLALEFSSTYLPALLSNGPPARGHYSNYSRNPDYLLLDLAEEDVDVLLGKFRTTQSGSQRSWWPSKELFPYNDFFVGEWTIHHEGWFRRRLESIETGNPTYGKPLVRYEWNRALEIAGFPLRRRANEVFPTMRDVEIAQNAWEERDGPWNGVLVRQIPLPS